MRGCGNVVDVKTRLLYHPGERATAVRVATARFVSRSIRRNLELSRSGNANETDGQTESEREREREREKGWMLHSGGKSGAAVSVAGRRGLGTRRGVPPVAGRRGCTRIMEKRWRAQSRLSRRAFAFARRVFAAQFRSRRNCTRIHPHSSTLSPLLDIYRRVARARARTHTHTHAHVRANVHARTHSRSYSEPPSSSVQSAARSREVPRRDQRGECTPPAYIRLR